MRILLTILVLAWGSNAWASNIPDADSPGGRLFVSRCSTCHALPHPKRMNWQHWRHMLTLMKSRMDERGTRPLTKEEWRLIASYVKTHAR